MMHAYRKTGFTLIELLVVVAIIAVLVSLLLPALSMARAVAKTTSCASNLRQIFMAARMYADDYSESPPAVGIDDSRLRPYFMWPGILGRLKYLRSDNLGSEWFGPTGVFKCPSEEFTGTLDFNGLRWFGTHYGVNHRLVFGTYLKPGPENSRYVIKFSQVHNPSQRYLYGDTVGTATTLLTPSPPWTFGTDRRHGLKPGYYGTTASWYQLSGEWNVVLVDGHVQTLDYIAEQDSAPWDGD